MSNKEIGSYAILFIVIVALFVYTIIRLTENGIENRAKINKEIQIKSCQIQGYEAVFIELSNGKSHYVGCK